MAETLWFGLPVYETLIPLCVWIVIIAHHALLVKQHTYSHAIKPGQTPSVYSFFAQARSGYIKQMFLTGQATANTTRDYLRVLLFYTGNCVVLSTFTAGYCASSYDPNGTAYAHLLTAKLGVLAVLFLVIFFVMIYAVRYGNHFHMIMNCKLVNGYELGNQLSIVEAVYNKSHFFYSTGVRMFFLLIPAFAWLLNCWVMLAMCPVHIYVLHTYDDISWLQKDIDMLFKKNKEEGEGGGELPLLGDGDGDGNKNSV